MLSHRIDDEVSLRMLNEGDAEEFYNLTISSKKYLREWLGWLDSIESIEDTAQNIRARLMAFAENGGYPKSFAIIYKGYIAGTIGFNDLNKSNRIGSRLLAGRAVSRERDYGKSFQGYCRIWI